NLLCSGALQRQDRWFAAEPAQYLGSVLVPVAQHQALGQRPLRGARPFLPDFIQALSVRWALLQACCQPKADCGRLLDPMDKVVSVVNTNVPPRPFGFPCLRPFVLL